jgi:predicted DNA-binding ribbon-helix-helix protein
MSNGKLPSGACGLIRSLRVSRLANRHDTESNISSEIRVIITTYQTKKISDDHPDIWRYTARRALVIFDHPYKADSARFR